MIKRQVSPVFFRFICLGGEKDMVIYCCVEHVDLALDVIIDEKETYPILEKYNTIHNLSTTCEFCEKTPVYIVSNERSHT